MVNGQGSFEVLCFVSYVVYEFYQIEIFLNKDRLTHFFNTQITISIKRNRIWVYEAFT